MIKEEIDPLVLAQLLENIPPSINDIYKDIPLGYEPKVPAKDLNELSQLIYEKKYTEAIKRGETLLKQYPNEGILHYELAEAYFKGRKEISNYGDYCLFYAKEALSNGIFCYGLLKRLVLELRKKRYYYQITQLWTFIDENREFVKSAIINIDMDYYMKKAELAKKEIIKGKAEDSPDIMLFTQEQLSKIKK